MVVDGLFLILFFFSILKEKLCHAYNFFLSIKLN